jgi:hypothetical protein
LNLPNFEIKTPAFLVGTAVQAGGGPGIPLQEAREAIMVETVGGAPSPEGVDLQEDTVPEPKAGDLSVDFDDLTLNPDNDDDMIETVDLDQLTDVESEIDLAINNLEADELLSDDAFEEVPTQARTGQKSTIDNIEEKLGDTDLTLDLEDLELELDLDGTGKK